MALGWRSSYLRYREVFLNIFALYKKRQDFKAFLEIILSAAAISFFAVFAIRPTGLTIVGLVGQIKEKESVVAQMDKKINDLATAQNLLKQENRIPIVESSVPNDPQVESFVGQLLGLSANRSVDILGVSIGEVALVGPQLQKAPDANLTPLPSGSLPLSFSLSVKGNYDSLIGFLNDIGNLRRPIQFDGVDLSISKDITNQFLVIVITGRTPYLKP